ncbi:hypothetical protein [Nocardia brasiliensis]|uniref:hypothetical protein n=1 Tax=Nocardia brasiliensis TaxID=37326 RepID=UPI00366EE01C
MTDLSALPWDQVGTVGLALIMTGLVVTGRLVPRATVDRLLADADNRNAFLERHIEAQQAVKSELASQNSELLGTARLATTLLRAVAPASTPRETPHVVSGEE